MSDFNPRRPYDDDQPDGMEESDRDYLSNNNDLAVALLDAVGSDAGMRRLLAKIMTSSPAMMTHAAQVFNDPENPEWLA